MKNAVALTSNTGVPVLKQALGHEWDSLSPSVQAHYGLSPFTDQQIRVKGVMDRVSHSRLAALIAPFTTLAGALIPYTGTNVPVDVLNYSRPGKAAYFWHRTFFFPGRKPFLFRSSMLCTAPGEVTEFVRFGLGIRLGVSVSDGRLVEHDRGYIWKVAGWTIPLPLNLMMGTSTIEEFGVSSREFGMRMALIHPLFGETFAYAGQFSIIAV